MGKKYTTNFLEDTNGSTGSANQVLVSTTAGIDWVDGSGSGIIGGPYLPLAGGTLSGNLELATNTLNFADNGKARFGNSTDLQIYHDGSNSYIQDTGIGSLYTLTNTYRLTNAAGTENMIWAAENSFVKLYYDNSAKLETTSTGVTITSDASNYLQMEVAGDGDSTISAVGSGFLPPNIKFNTNSTTVLAISGTLGYVGIGTVTPSERLEVNGDILATGYRVSAMQTAPATRNSTGTLGEVRITSNYIYVCYATNSWSRVALATSW